MIVVDTNVIAYFSFPGSYTEEVMQLHEADSDWIAPVLWKSEFLNITALYLRKKLIEYDDALETMEKAARLLRNKEFTVSGYRVLDLVNESSCSAYDCEFVALAIEKNVRMITYDKLVLKEFSAIASTPLHYLSAIQ